MNAFDAPGKRFPEPGAATGGPPDWAVYTHFGNCDICPPRARPTLAEAEAEAEAEAKAGMNSKDFQACR